eukprot:11955019-Alexandrium_andersonii.AAC.1
MRPRTAHCVRWPGALHATACCEPDSHLPRFPGQQRARPRSRPGSSAGVLPPPGLRPAGVL